MGNWSLSSCARQLVEACSDVHRHQRGQDLRMGILGAYQQIKNINCKNKSLQLISTDFICIVVTVLFHKANMLLLSSASQNKAPLHKTLVSENEAELTLNFDKTPDKSLEPFIARLFVAVNYMILVKRLAFSNLKIVQHVLGNAL